MTSGLLESLLPLKKDERILFTVLKVRLVYEVQIWTVLGRFRQFETAVFICIPKCNLFYLSEFISLTKNAVYKNQICTNC